MANLDEMRVEIVSSINNMSESNIPPTHALDFFLWEEIEEEETESAQSVGNFCL